VTLTATALALPELLLLEPAVHHDARGRLFEAFNAEAFATATGVRTPFVQDTQSRSVRGVLRGLHFQVAPSAQGKLVRVLAGEIFDVAVDVRVGSPTLGRWVGVALRGDRPQQLWVPPGFAHGFLVLSEVAEVLYKTTTHRAPAEERVLRWDDAEVGVAWPLDGPPVLSARDAAGSSLRTLVG
jgi:dTDP-4-dehydrorhamnose 3,5-epimerase